jgi:methionyl-tRNA formyltransferase
LARYAYGILKKVLDQIKDGKLKGTPQNEAEATLAPQLTKQDGELSFAAMTAEAMDRKVRGLQPWPGAYCFIKGERVSLVETGLAGSSTAPKPGTLLAIDKDGGVQIAAKSGVLKVLKVKPEGKKVMSGADFVRGRRFPPGAVLSEKD